jgi:hypothetical protein
MKKQSRSPQDQKQTKIRIANRRARLVKLFAEGKTISAAHKQLAKEGIEVSRATVGFDLQALAALAPANIQTARAEAHSELTALKKFVMGADDMKDTETVNSLLAIHDRIVTLLGLAAPTKSISAKVNADVDPTALVGYRRFVAETRGLDAEQIEAVYKFARSLARPTITVTDVPERSDFDEA